MSKNKEKQLEINTKSWYFFRVQDLIFEDENLDIYAKTIYTVICKYADMNTNKAFPSIKTIAKKASCSKPKARQSVNKLVEAGYITRKYRKKEQGNYNSNLYKIKDLSYISDGLKFAKENNSKSLENKILNRLNEHPIPSKKEIYKFIGNSDIDLEKEKEEKSELKKLYESGYR